VTLEETAMDSQIVELLLREVTMLGEDNVKGGSSVAFTEDESVALRPLRVLWVVF
jgi:hypothetical protein